MQLLHNAVKFTKGKTDLKGLYMTNIRPVLEQSSVVWHSTLTSENSGDIERVQKAAVRLIMGSNHTCYEETLQQLKLRTLSERRSQLV